MNKMIRSFTPMLLVSLIACNNNAGEKESSKFEREIGDSIVKEAIVQGYDAKDTGVINAYLNDRSTITINDIDPGDKSYSTRAKILYKSNADPKILAVVFGYKNDDKPGMAVMQKTGEKPIVLKEGKRDGDVRVYSNGEITLQQSGTFVFIGGVQYEEIK
ncbi:hypothetical protein ACTJIJ_23380 [Niabella sp. 22666]|uniref:hypothetical protein n=1 Tax=Niabella sp. 22666 TaxID=3453954 RepID=UPI003F850479